MRYPPAADPVAQMDVSLNEQLIVSYSR
jgi:hypothetical protein